MNAQKPQYSKYRKMEELISRMQNKTTGVELKNQRSRFATIPDVFTGEDAIKWLNKSVAEDEQAAQNLATLLCHHGYIFPVTDTKSPNVKADGTPYRFQDRRFWLSGSIVSDDEAYAIYLKTRSQRGKQKHGLEDYEQDALDKLESRLSTKMGAIELEVRKSLRNAKEMDKNAKAVYDSQEKAFWKVQRPAPGHVKRCEEGLQRYFHPLQVQERREKKEFLIKKVQMLRKSHLLAKMRISQVVEMYHLRTENDRRSDPFLTPAYWDNPWVSDGSSWASCKDTPAAVNAQRVNKWAFSLRDLLADSWGQAEFKAFLEKEYSQENLHFWCECEEMKHVPASSLWNMIDRMYSEYLVDSAPHEVNIDSRTRQQVKQNMEECRSGRPSRFIFLQAQEQIFRLMMKDSYVRFLRSDQYNQHLSTAVQPEGKKGFLSSSFSKKCTLTPSPKMKRRGPTSVSEDLREGGSMKADSHHSHSTSDLLSVEEKTVNLRKGKYAQESSLKKCTESSPCLSRKERGASFTRDGSFSKKQQLQQLQQQQKQESSKHKSLNLDMIPHHP